VLDPVLDPGAGRAGVRARRGRAPNPASVAARPRTTPSGSSPRGTARARPTRVRRGSHVGTTRWWRGPTAPV